MWYLSVILFVLFVCLHRTGSFLINCVPDGPLIICEMPMILTQETELIRFFSAGF